MSLSIRAENSKIRALGYFESFLERAVKVVTYLTA